ncbi:hypothetical protein UK23_32645 [Lentzea aerocolonigenes]|uniref:SpoVT-AbrB domain-containing protein n=1 Tax=Lentzea aerocolonigenes TaxID=68170 RepID=A0A0F0GJ48_LENAE|nr:hypothetical protein [Lentzea aerocolonigenes]KJK43579.1 hypothetical protein UK23_32645 [Lentzea aerocolonigenes]
MKLMTATTGTRDDREHRRYRPGPTIAESIIGAVVPDSLTAASLAREPLPSLNLSELSGDGTIHFGMAAIDDHGRFTDRRILRTLSWRPDDRIDIALRDDIIVVRSAHCGSDLVSPRGFIKLPLPIRRWRSLNAGDRLLLVSVPTAAVLLAYDCAALGKILNAHHAPAAGLDHATPGCS